MAGHSLSPALGTTREVEVWCVQWLNLGVPCYPLGCFSHTLVSHTRGTEFCPIDADSLTQVFRGSGY